MTETELIQSFDAAVWAKEFCDIYEKNHGMRPDEEWMITWFANALMRGYDEHRWKTEREGRLALPAWQSELRAKIEQLPTRFDDDPCQWVKLQDVLDVLPPPPAAEGETPSLAKDDLTPLANVNEMGTGNIK